MGSPDELARVSTEKNVALLSNAIASCTIENDMPLEYLDKAYEDIQQLYRKNALMPKCEGLQNQYGGSEEMKKDKKKKKQAASGRKQPVPVKIQPGMSVVLNRR